MKRSASWRRGCFSTLPGYPTCNWNYVAGRSPGVLLVRCELITSCLPFTKYHLRAFQRRTKDLTECNFDGLEWELTEASWTLFSVRRRRQARSGAYLCYEGKRFSRCGCTVSSAKVSGQAEPAGCPDPRPRETVSRQSVRPWGPPLHTACGTCGRRDNDIPVLSTRSRHAPKYCAGKEAARVGAPAFGSTSIQKGGYQWSERRGSQPDRVPLRLGRDGLRYHGRILAFYPKHLHALRRQNSV
jgi:hypothetical protein